MSHMQPLAISYGDAGKLLGVSDRTVRRMVAAGELPSLKIRNQNRIPYQSVVELVQEKAHHYKDIPCHTNGKIRATGGSPTPTLAADKLAKVLKLPISQKRKR